MGVGVSLRLFLFYISLNNGDEKSMRRACIFVPNAQNWSIIGSNFGDYN